MKFIKLGLISAVVFFLLLLAFASLLPSHIRISRAINIKAPHDTVQSRLLNLTTWRSWNEYVKAMGHPVVSAGTITDPELTISLKSVQGSDVQTSWHQQRNGKTFAGAFHLISSGEITTVQWYFDFYFRWYPWEKFSSITYDKQIGPQMEQSLENLRRQVEP